MQCLLTNIIRISYILFKENRQEVHDEGCRIQSYDVMITQQALNPSEPPGPSPPPLSDNS